MIRTQIIHVGSANRRIGTVSDFWVSLPHGLFKADRPSRIFVTPVDCVMNRSWYTVSASNNTFSVWDSGGGAWSPVTIPPGYYNAAQIRTAVVTALAALGQAWQINYSATSNTFTFTPPADGEVHRMSFANNAAWLLGFAVGDVPFGTSVAPFKSTRPIKVNEESAVLVRCNLPRLKFSCVDNVLTPVFGESDILLKVPVLAQGFDTLYYAGQGADNFKVELATNNVHDVRFWVTDEVNNPLELQYDWTLSLRVDYMAGEEDPMDAVAKSTRRIADDLRLMILTGGDFSPDGGFSPDGEKSPT